jgi:hypothetical protein
MLTQFCSIALVLAQAAGQPDSATFKPIDLSRPPASLGGKWTLENGEVIGHADAGQTAWLPLPGEYSDFDFEGEFMTSSPANGGIAFRAHWLPTSPEDHASAKAMFGYQVSVDTRDAAHSGEILTADAAARLSAATKDAAATSKPGAWNKIAIHAAGSTVLVRINGTPAATSYDEAYIGGMFALRADGNEIRFRNLRVRDLGRGQWRPLFDGKSLTGWKNWGTEDFHVKDGLIECRRGPKESEGYLATEESFTDFRVRGKFKMLGSRCARRMGTQSSQACKEKSSRRFPVAPAGSTRVIGAAGSSSRRRPFPPHRYCAWANGTKSRSARRATT